MNRKVMIPAAVAGTAIAGAAGYLTLRRLTANNEDEYLDYDPAEGPEADTGMTGWTGHNMYQPEDSRESHSQYTPDIPDTPSSDPNQNSSWNDDRLYAPNERDHGEARKATGS